MRRKVKAELALLCLLAVCLALAGCAGAGAYSGVSIKNADAVSDMIRSSMLKRAYSVKVSFDTRLQDTKGMDEVVADLMEGALYESDNPKGGDYIRYQSGGYTLTHSVEEGFFKNKYKARIVPSYYTTAEQEDEVDVLVAGIVDGMGLSEDSGEYERARCVRDYICDNVDYDTVHKHLTGSKHIQSTAYAALTYHSALCQGYSVLCYRLLKELGLDARIVTGEAVIDGVSERHAWNIVRIGGNYYNMDVTLDDVNGTDEYFLKSDGTFAADHARDGKYKAEDFYISYPMSLEDYTK